MCHPVDGEGPKPRVEKNSVVVVPALLFPYIVRGHVAGELVLQRVRRGLLEVALEAAESAVVLPMGCSDQLAGSEGASNLLVRTGEKSVRRVGTAREKGGLARYGVRRSL